MTFYITHQLQSQKSRSQAHIICTSHLPLLNSGNKMLYLCHQRWSGAYHIGQTQWPHLLSLKQIISLPVSFSYF